MGSLGQVSNPAWMPAQAVMDTLKAVGISMKQVTDDLVTQAVKLFAEPFDKLLNSVDAKCKLVSTKEVDPQTYSVPAEMQVAGAGRRGRLENGGQGAPLVGSRRLAVERNG